MSTGTQELRTDELKVGMQIRLASRRGTSGFSEYYTLTNIETLPNKKYRLYINDRYESSDIFAARTHWFVRDTSKDLTPEEQTENLNKFLSKQEKISEKKIIVTIYSRTGFDDGTCMHCYSNNAKVKATHIARFGDGMKVPLCDNHIKPYL